MSDSKQQMPINVVQQYYILIIICCLRQVWTWKCVLLCEEKDFGGLGTDKTGLVGCWKHFIINYRGWCNAEGMVGVVSRKVLDLEHVWHEILITGVHRVAQQLIEAILVWSSCDELPAVFVKWPNMVVT